MCLLQVQYSTCRIEIPINCIVNRDLSIKVGSVILIDTFLFYKVTGTCVYVIYRV